MKVKDFIAKLNTLGFTNDTRGFLDISNNLVGNPKCCILAIVENISDS